MQDYTVDTRHQAEQDTAVLETTLSVPEIGPWLGRAYATVAETLAAQHLRPTGPPFARYYGPDGGHFRVEAGFPVEAPIAPAGEVHPSRLPGGTSAVTVHTGPYDAMEPAYDVITSWIRSHGGEPVDAPWETYLDDPGQHPDPATWHTEIVQPYRVPGH
ncbi:GyrI-like domain-containing protein [Amycolatopsis benzoatilytica]|uniref:GyrI-like domain-containing protein n=1 Tax=Amycolatopsis benzoatilytica TaxID=346045 RepID=UPI000375B389|nr:GyrI-like domain-containing protein [Amycolatopsis benzoatilytica]